MELPLVDRQGASALTSLCEGGAQTARTDPRYMEIMRMALLGCREDAKPHGHGR